MVARYGGIWVGVNCDSVRFHSEIPCFGWQSVIHARLDNMHQSHVQVLDSCFYVCACTFILLIVYMYCTVVLYYTHSIWNMEWNGFSIRAWYEKLNASVANPWTNNPFILLLLRVILRVLLLRVLLLRVLLLRVLLLRVLLLRVLPRASTSFFYQYFPHLVLLSPAKEIGHGGGLMSQSN